MSSTTGLPGMEANIRSVVTKGYFNLKKDSSNLILTANVPEFVDMGINSWEFVLSEYGL